MSKAILYGFLKFYVCQSPQISTLGFFFASSLVWAIYAETTAN